MKKKKRNKKGTNQKDKNLMDCYIDSDDTFAFIAGYTSGGAPYGTTWEELGLEPFASQEEIDAAYEKL